MTEEKKDFIPYITPINFWVRHLSFILGLIGIFYLTSETRAMLPKIPLEELVHDITIYSLICYSLVIAYFVVHYIVSILGRARDVGVPMWIGILLLVMSMLGVGHALIEGSVGSLASLAPVALLYLMTLMPGGLLRDNEATSEPPVEVENLFASLSVGASDR